MDAEESTELRQTAAIREEIEQTRIALGRKLEMLEDEVRQTAANAKNAVTDYVEETKRAFDIREHVRARPWALFGSSVAAGFVAARILGPSRSYRPQGNFGGASNGSDRSFSSNGASLISGLSSSASSSSFLSHFRDEIDEVKSAAIGTILGALRDYAVTRVPPTVAPKVQEIANHLTSKLGGTPFHGTVFDRTGRDSDARTG